MEITGPRVIQNIIYTILEIENKDGCFPGQSSPQIHLKDTDFEFVYQKQDITNHKSQIYKQLQQKYKRLDYIYYNYI